MYLLIWSVWSLANSYHSSYLIKGCPMPKSSGRYSLLHLLHMQCVSPSVFVNYSHCFDWIFLPGFLAYTPSLPTLVSKCSWRPLLKLFVAVAIVTYIRHGVVKILLASFIQHHPLFQGTLSAIPFLLFFTCLWTFHQMGGRRIYVCLWFPTRYARPSHWHGLFDHAKEL